MQLFIDNRSGIPIYDQIYKQIKDQIISGTLKEDDPLPSIRTLAKDLKISVITTKRAYEELEKEGFLYTVQGKGSFVASRNNDLVREHNLRIIEEHMSKIAELAASLDLSEEDIMEMFRIMWREEE